MPLLDHHRPPFSRTHPWRTFHGTWAVAMARLLNSGVLPPGYYALPFLDRDGPIEIDVATLHTSGPSAPEAHGAEPWSPGEPAAAVAIEWPPTDDVRVEVLTDDGDPRLMAAVELVSPGNKDRATAREAFAAKCAEHLSRGRGVVVVDAVTTRTANLHAGVFAALGAEPPANHPTGLNAVSYRPLGRDANGQLQTWPFVLEVGQPLPTVALWLGGEFAVPLDLERSHSAACSDLGIRPLTESAPRV